MENNGNIDLVTAFKKLLAENNSQRARLDEYARLLESRNNEIEMLQSMLSQANEYRSNTDDDLRQLKELRTSIGKIQQEVLASGYMSAGTQQRVAETVSVEKQLEALNVEYTYLQAQLKDLQTQLLAANNTNLLLQQRSARVAELESKLATAEDEISYWKSKAGRLQ